MPTINGKPSVFITPSESPPSQEQVPESAPSYDPYIADQIRLANEWLADEAAQLEYQEWSDAAYGEPSDEELERMAEEWRLAQLGTNYVRAINGKDDFRWDNGGVK